MLKRIKKIVILIFIVLVLLMQFSTYSNAVGSYLNLNALDFKATINPDGSMDVVETWDIDIRYTNTLYKTFEMDEDKFSEITNVKVKEITDGTSKEFTDINEEMYHVTKDCYYGLVNSKGKFEIAWGVGLDDTFDRRTYEISYTVKDAIAKYNDYAELYWQFIGEDFEIDADEITGTIILPEDANDLDDIKVWGHTENLNGEIYVTALNEITFEVNNFISGRYVEVRSLFPKDMITNTNRTYNEDRYEEVVKEETKWANQANARRQWEEIKDDVIAGIFLLITVIVGIVFLIKTIKYVKKLKSIKKYKPEQELEYYRELPEKNTTPGEAVYILEEPYNSFTSKFGKIFSATILDLKLKGCLDLRVEKEDKKKEKIYIIKVKRIDDSLKREQQAILNFISNAYKSKKEIEIKDLEKYITSHSSSVQKLIKQTEKDIENELLKDGKYTKTAKEEHKKYGNICGAYFFGVFITFSWAFPLAAILLINGILCLKIRKRINVLTQKGINEKEKWKGLKKYMEDFSLLNEKEVPAIEVWEHYLVYATAFGISAKVLKQLKTIYPNIDELSSVNTSTYMYFMYHSNFSSSISRSVSSSMSTSYSSGTGGGGGFSGGGGGGRRPEEVEEADNALHR